MKTWLVTGCSSGLGKALSEAILAHGDRLVVTARQVEKVRPLQELYPERALALSLDVTDDHSVEQAVHRALEHFDGIDVLVNNAGYCLRGAVEECAMADIEAQFATNFFGTVRTIQKVLPHMRKARKGTIVNFSSIAALRTSPGSSFYAASKCAVEGLSDGLRKETAPFGVRVIVVEPGPFRTDFFARSIAISPTNIEEYRETAGKRKVRLDVSRDTNPAWGDNGNAARVIIRAVETENGPFRLLLGSHAVALGREVMAERAAEIGQWQELSVQTDVQA